MKHRLQQILAWLKSKRRYLPGILAIIFISLIVYFIWANWDEFKSISIVHSWALIGLALCAMCNLFATGRVMDVVLRPHGLHLHPLESYGLAALSRLVNQVTPGQTGLILRATYLKKKYGLSVQNFLAALAGTHVFIFVVASGGGLLAIWLLSFSGIIVPNLFTLVLAGVFLGLLTLLFIPVRLKPRDHRFLKHLIATVNGWQTIREDRSTLLWSVFWSVMLLLTIMGMVFFSFNSLGAAISPLGALFITSIIVAGGIVSLTPSGLGINEALGVLAGKGVGVDPHIALTAVLLQRLVVTAVLYTTTPFISRWLLGKSLRDTIKSFRKKQSSVDKIVE